MRTILDSYNRYTVEYNGKRCYSSEVVISDLQGNVKIDFNPTVIVSMSNNPIITAYPTSSQDCTRQAPWAF